MKKTLALLTAILFFASCEECMDLDFNCGEPRVVIEGSINDIEYKSAITLSKTGDSFEAGGNSSISNAEVTVTDDKGIPISFKETESGIYTADKIQGVENTTYTLNVLAEGESYTAEATMPQKVNIDYLSFEKTPPSSEFQGGYLVNCHFNDLVGIDNYYRLKVYNLNDKTEGMDGKHLFDDEYFDGEEMVRQWETEQFMPNDIVVVELQTLEKSAYDYYSGLFSADGCDLDIPNPETNIDNNALGCFATFTISRDTIYILPN